LRTRVIPERFWGDDHAWRGASLYQLYVPL